MDIRYLSPTPNSLSPKKNALLYDVKKALDSLSSSNGETFFHLNWLKEALESNDTEITESQLILLTNTLEEINTLGLNTEKQYDLIDIIKGVKLAIESTAIDTDLFPRITVLRLAINFTYNYQKNDSLAQHGTAVLNAIINTSNESTQAELLVLNHLAEITTIGLVDPTNPNNQRKLDQIISALENQRNVSNAARNFKIALAITVAFALAASACIFTPLILAGTLSFTLKIVTSALVASAAISLGFSCCYFRKKQNETQRNTRVTELYNAVVPLSNELKLS